MLNKFLNFLNINKDNLKSCEFYLPLVVSELIAEEKASVEVLRTSAVWYGMTYKEDLDIVKEKINKYINDDLYPNNLWQ